MQVDIRGTGETWLQCPSLTVKYLRSITVEPRLHFLGVPAPRAGLSMLLPSSVTLLPRHAIKLSWQDHPAGSARLCDLGPPEVPEEDGALSPPSPLVAVSGVTARRAHI